jgi:hypothetical protein
MGFFRGAAVLVAAVVFLVLALTVLLSFMGLMRMADYYSEFVTVRTPRVGIVDLYPELSTGDLIYFVASTSSGINSMLTQTFFSHVAVVLREGDLVCVSETSTGSELMPTADGAEVKLPSGATITPLLTKLKYYTGAAYYSRLAPPLDADAAETLKREAERLAVARHPYPPPVHAVLGVFGRRTPARHCFQHAAHLLDVAGLSPRDGAPLSDASFVAAGREVCSLPGRELRGGRSYEPPAQILYDIF